MTTLLLNYAPVFASVMQGVFYAISAALVLYKAWRHPGA